MPVVGRFGIESAVGLLATGVIGEPGGGGAGLFQLLVVVVRSFLAEGFDLFVPGENIVVSCLGFMRVLVGLNF